MPTPEPIIKSLPFLNPRRLPFPSDLPLSYWRIVVHGIRYQPRGRRSRTLSPAFHRTAKTLL